MIKTFEDDQAVESVVGTMRIFVGAQNIGSAQLSIVGARTPTKVYKLAPMFMWSSPFVEYNQQRLPSTLLQNS